MKIRIDPLDKIFSEYIRKRAIQLVGGCEVCQAGKESWKNLQCCHFNGRGMKSVRWDEDNAIGACFSCHQRLDSFPMEKVEWWRKHLGQEAFDMLEGRKRQMFPKPDKAALTLYYQAKLRGMVQNVTKLGDVNAKQ